MNSSYLNQDKGYYVYAKTTKSSSDDNVGACVNYMMRYAARPAMAESRINRYDKASDSVEWFYDDHRTEERMIVKESGLDLLKKIIIHIPDTGFRMIRYYGFYNNKEQALLDKLHELLGRTRKISRDRNERKRALRNKLNRLHFRTMCMDSYNRDILRCKCGAVLVYVDSYNPLDGRSNDRYYRQECINEMRELWLRRAGPPLRA